MSLKEKIVESLKRKPGQFAKEIARELGVDRSEVNSVLYKQLQGVAIQDKSYRWTLAGSGNTQAG